MAKHSHVSYGQKTKSLVKLIEQAAYQHSVWQVFSDFLEMSAISISNSIDPVHREERENRYWGKHSMSWNCITSTKGSSSPLKASAT